LALGCFTYENNENKKGQKVNDLIIGLLQLVGVVSLVAFVGALCAATLIALTDRNPWPKRPMFMHGEYRCYVNRRRVSERA